MAGKARNRKPLEWATFIGIDSLSLARQPAGWNRRGEARRVVGIRHLRGGSAIAETILRAEVGVTAGLLTIEHRGADGMKIEQSVELAPIAMPRGGQRWCFVCPVTGGLARKLYRYPGLWHFCSRKGLPEPVTYGCQRDSAAKRTMRQIWELRERLGDKGPLLGSLAEPDGMSEAEFLRHVRRYLQLASRLNFSPHGIKMRKAS
ncbi:hypothetical protein [Luteimonas arsenica]|uniref:hypothetical protein n=1 Tax=Luteimonas arsenica TaxID=1586242 RepID=UPI001055D874|nr:hypothetical protein [Luteimonas arsenica]